MPYITVSNSKKIIRSLNQVRLEEIEIEIYKNKISFFNDKEIGRLKGIREFLRDPDNFSTQYYEPLQVKDSFRYVYPEKNPSYHEDNTCPNLNSNFINVEIPFEIRERGEEEVKKFRNWHETNKLLYESDIKKYIFKLQHHFLILREINPQSIEFENSGQEEIKNYDIKELENKIDSIISDASRYYWDNPDKQSVIRRFGKLTFLAYVNGDIYTNDSGLNDDELKTFLRQYDNNFKTPVKNLLIEYYRLLHNPDMTFEGRLLDKLNFKPCRACMDT